MPSQADDERFLHRGWEWLEENADHDPRPENYDALDAEWYRRLHLYEEAYRLVTMDIQRRDPSGGDVRARRGGPTEVRQPGISGRVGGDHATDSGAPLHQSTMEYH